MPLPPWGDNVLLAVEHLEGHMNNGRWAQAERVGEALWADAALGRTAWYAYLDTRLSATPTCPWARAQMALAQALEGDAAAGAARVAGVPDLLLGAHGRCAAAMALAEQGRVEGALLVLRTAIGVHPRSALVHWRRAILLLQAHDLAAARLAAQQALAWLPTLQDAALLRAEVHLLLGEVGMAASSRRRVTAAGVPGRQARVRRVDGRLYLAQAALALGAATAMPETVLEVVRTFIQAACRRQACPHRALRLLGALACLGDGATTQRQLRRIVLRLLHLQHTAAADGPRPPDGSSGPATSPAAAQTRST